MFQKPRHLCRTPYCQRKRLGYGTHPNLCGRCVVQKLRENRNDAENTDH